ncbi:alpha/beta hydrolase [Elizabethkingia argentiflava]|uniref:Alpha/beta hydrolase n=1 Tax=Elizabethkingia argenteiflava TaxID=2681556 RepID=A0A845PX89_9FLAO|nr:patatin-like phospholipase family protein [Elizabethkingia argenteiflava]NAW51561.1 alpha/beta hydrolase [Elizabethkingia argenteiflava]
MESQKNITLVLSGGGARGLAHIGVIEELERQNFKINSIIGTSMGALIGGFYAMGKLEEFKTWILKLNRYSLLRLLDISFKNGGVIKGEKTLNSLRNSIPGKDIETLEIPFACVATNLKTNQSVLLDSGNIYDVIRASIAIPPIFTPVIKDDMILVDGGILNNIPTDYALQRQIPNSKILAVDVNSRIPFKGKTLPTLPRLNMLRLTNHIISLMVESIGSFNIDQHPPDFMINTSRYSCELYAFFKAKHQIEYGRKCAREQLASYPY